MKEDNLTFRISCIPHHVQPWSFEKLLLSLVPNLKSGDFEVRTFVPSVDDFSIPPSRTATVRFRNVPEEFKNGSNEWSKEIPGWGEKLVLDTHFNDFTPLNEVDPNIHQFE
jgi:hypothetical protein